MILDPYDFSKLVNFANLMCQLVETSNIGLILHISKGQLISEGNFGVFKSPKNVFVRISALASKMDQIKNIKALFILYDK